MHKIFADCDKLFIFIVAVILIVGLFVLASASSALSEKQFQAPYYYIVNQLSKGFLPGVLALILGLVIPYSWWRKVAFPLLLFSLALMMLIFIPQLGFSHGGATRWLVFGPLTFQPSEILKLTLIIYLASWLESRKSVIQEYSATFVPFVIIMSIVAVFLAMQPDLGTLMIISANALFMYMAGGSRWTQIAALILLGFIGIFIFLQLMPYSRDRLLVFLNPAHDPLGKGYQINQAFMAIGSGGFWGRGVGESMQKYGFLPEPVGDSIFSVFAEEFGFLGSIILLSLFLIFCWRGLFIAASAPNIFGQLLCAGIIFSITIQAFINIAANAGLVPLTGVPLPFISYGGTSLAISMAKIGIVLNISKNSV